MMENKEKNQTCAKCGNPVPSEAPQGLCPHCVLAGAAATDDILAGATATGETPSLDRVAKAFPHLEIVELIGRGAMGFVYKARQPHLDRFVALKLLPDKLARDPQFAERFNREGKVLARLNHPNIVSVFDFGRTEHFYFLLMEYVDGVNLRQSMHAGRFSPAEALAVVPKICEALQYAHEQGVLHRDIKPENILIDTRGRVKIADFGIAKLVDEEAGQVALTGTGAALGTPHYMAPEQLEKPQTVDHRADIYSLGVVFYEMLTGELPIGRFAPPSAKTPVNVSVDEVVLRTLEKEREKRYQSAAEVKTNIEHLTTQGKVLAEGVVGSGTGAGGKDSGPHGTTLAAGDPGGKKEWCRRAIYGATLTALSLPLPFFMATSLVLGRGGVSNVELWIALANVCLPGMGGTMLGWVALVDIKESAGQLKGLPLAAFAALTWPLLVLGGGTIVLPNLVIVPDQATGWTILPARLLLMILPAGVLTLAIWAVYATFSWVSRRHTFTHGPLLRRIFLGTWACGAAVVMITQPARHLRGNVGKPEPQTHTEEVRTAEPLQSPRPIRMRYKLNKGQLVTFMLCRHQGDTHIFVPHMSGYVVAPDDRGVTGELKLKPQPTGTNNAPQLWDLEIVSDTGQAVATGVAELGPLNHLPGSHPVLSAPASPFPQNTWELPLTLPGPDGGALCVIGREEFRPRNYRAPEAPLLGTSTNWEHGLALTQVLESQGRPAEETTDHIRFTITSVNLIEAANSLWLGIDYVLGIQGNCRLDVRQQGTTFAAESRTFELGASAGDKSTKARVEFRLPGAVKFADAAQVSRELSEALAGQTVKIPVSTEVPLFNVPLGDVGALRVNLRANPGI